MSRLFDDIPLPRYYLEQEQKHVPRSLIDNSAHDVIEKRILAFSDEPGLTDEERARRGIELYQQLLEEHQGHEYLHWVRRSIWFVYADITTVDRHLKPELLTPLHRQSDSLKALSEKEIIKSLVLSYASKLVTQPAMAEKLTEIESGSVKSIFLRYLNLLFRTTSDIDNLLERIADTNDPHQDALENLEIAYRYQTQNPTIKAAGKNVHDAIKEAEDAVDQQFLTEFADASRIAILSPDNTENLQKLNGLSQAPRLQTFPAGKKLSLAGTTLVTVTMFALTLLALYTLTILWPIALLALGTLIGSGVDVSLYFQEEPKKAELFEKGASLFRTARESVPSTTSVPTPPLSPTRA